MNPDLVPALIAAGLSAAAAQRVATAIVNTSATGQPTTPPPNTQFTRPPGSGMQQVVGGKAAFAVYASAANTGLQAKGNSYLFGPGGGALGVNGVSVFNGDIYCGGLLATSVLDVGTDAVVTGKITCQQLDATTVRCLNSFTASDTRLTTTVPVDLQSDLSVAGQAALNGNITLNGQTNIQGKVFWGGNFRAPADVQVLAAAQIDGDDNLVLTTAAVGVLTPVGNPPPVKIDVVFDPILTKITDLLTFNADTCQLEIPAGLDGMVVTAANVRLARVV